MDYHLVIVVATVVEVLLLLLKTINLTGCVIAMFLVQLSVSWYLLSQQDLGII